MLSVETIMKQNNKNVCGIFPKNKIKKDTIVWEFKDHFDIKVEMEKFKELTPVQQCFVLRHFWKIGDFLYGSCDSSMLLKHSNKPNLIHKDADYKVLYAAKDIDVNEELCKNYNVYNLENPNWGDSLNKMEGMNLDGYFTYAVKNPSLDFFKNKWKF
jgi:hypothetical protein